MDKKEMSVLMALEFCPIQYPNERLGAFSIPKVQTLFEKDMEK